MTSLKRGREADAKCCRGEEEKNQQETVQSKTALGEISFYPTVNIIADAVSKKD